MMMCASCVDDPEPQGDGTIMAPTLSSPAWSVDDRIVYEDRGSRLEGENWVYVDSLAGLWILDYRSGEKFKLAVSGDSPDWSPSGEQLVCRSNNALLQYDLESGRSEILVPDYRGTFLNPADWGPCAECLVFASTREAPLDYTLWLYRFDTGKSETLLDNVGGLRYPHWSAGCDSIFFTRFAIDNGNFPLILSKAAIDGTGERVVLQLPDGAKKIDVSPDSRFLCFDRFAQGNERRINIYDMAEAKYLEAPPGDARDGKWLPDSRRIVYVGPPVNKRGRLNRSIAVYSIENQEVEYLLY